MDIAKLQERIEAQDAEIKALGERLVEATTAQAEGAARGIDYKKRVYVRNVTGVDTYVRLRERPADVCVPKGNRVLFTVGEVLEQVHTARNRSFIGVDGKGNKASLHIEDAEARELAGIADSQEIVDEKAILALFAGDAKKFSAVLKKRVTTFGEKQALRDILSGGKVNDHDKIKIAEAYLSGA